MTQVLETFLLLHLLHWMSLNIQTSNVVGLAGSLESEAPRKFDHIYMFAKLGDLQVCPSQKNIYFLRRHVQDLHGFMMYYSSYYLSSPSALHPKKLLPVTMSCLWPPVYSRVTVKAVGSWFCEPWTHACRGSTTQRTLSSSRLRKGR